MQMKLSRSTSCENDNAWVTMRMQEDDGTKEARRRLVQGINVTQK